MLLLLAMFFTATWAAPIRVLELRGSVDPGSADYIVSAIEQAEEDGAAAVVLRLDTPGGLVTSAREIVQAELTAEIPIIVYVEPSGARAGSAGVFITMAAHVAAMAPGTTIGAAHPVDLFGGGAKEEKKDGSKDGAGGSNVMEEKILNDTTAWARAIAQERERNADWAVSAVRESAAITAREALELDVIDLIAPDLETLLAEIDGRPIKTAAGELTLQTRGEQAIVEMSIRQRLVHILGDPNVLFALVALGMLGLYIEFHNPGLIIPGVTGAALLLAAAVGMSLVPFNVGGLLLVLFAFAAFALEVWVGGYGVYAVIGAVALVTGGVLLFDVEGYDLRVDTTPLVIIAGIVAAVSLIVGVLVAQAHRSQPETGSEALVGARATVCSGGDGSGRVQVQGEDWAARWTGEIAEGAEVHIVRVDGLLLHVTRDPSVPSAQGEQS